MELKHWTSAAMGLAVATALFAGWTAHEGPQDVLKARRIEIVDASGRVRLSIGPSRDSGRIGIEILDDGGRVALRQSVSDDGAFVSVSLGAADAGDTVTLSANPHAGAMFSLESKLAESAGAECIINVQRLREAHVHLASGAGGAFAINLRPSGSVEARMFGKGNGAIGLLTDSDGAAIGLQDVEGNVGLSAAVKSPRTGSIEASSATGKLHSFPSGQ